MIRNKFINGFLVGLVLPVVALIALYYLDQALASSESVNITGDERRVWQGFKLRTLVLIALCFNVIPTYLANKRRFEEFIRGIMVPTVLFCFVWFFYFRETLFSS